MAKGSALRRNCRSSFKTSTELSGWAQTNKLWKSLLRPISARALCVGWPETRNDSESNMYRKQRRRVIVITQVFELRDNMVRVPETCLKLPEKIAPGNLL